MPIRLELPKSLAHWVVPRPWLRVTPAEVAAVEFRGWRYPLALQHLPSLPEPEHLRQWAAGVPQQTGALVVRALLPTSVRSLLEENDIGYLDSRGNLHLVLPTGIVHVEGVRTSRPVRQASLGVKGVRAVQEVLARDEPFSVSLLARETSLSLASTHAVLGLLEREGFVRTTAAGHTRWRAVAQRTELLDWLETQPAARRRPEHLDVTVYSRRPHDLWAKIAHDLTRADIAYALTGGAAVSLFGTGPTAVTTSLLRIHPDVPLAVAAEALGATVTNRGPNLRLLRDTGRVGTLRTEEREKIRIAPRVRIYLDALGERRGSDVARQFREVVLGY